MTTQDQSNFEAAEMSLDTYKDFQELIYELSGISLAASKRALLMNRITKRMRSLKIRTPEDYLNYVQANRDTEVEKLIDVVSTNVTHFFREEPHFEFLKKLCLQWKATNQKKIKIWCAAASSGQEPYTIGMTLVDNLNLQNMDVKILGTDICSDVLLRATEGRYNESEINNIPSHLLGKYFETVGSDNGDNFVIKSSVKDLITYKRLNLAEFPYPLKGSLDVIFCRNVMIYFDRPMRQKVIDQFYSLIQPGGHLILSHSENLLGISHKFNSLGASIFQK